MKFTTQRTDILPKLQAVAKVINQRHTFPILANVLLELNGNMLVLTGSDLEAQIRVTVEVDAQDSGTITVPAKKLLDIAKTASADTLTFDLKDERMTVRSGRSRFTLNTLPSENYPAFDSGAFDTDIQVSATLLRRAMQKTLFAMADQDVRFYLNGLLFELDGIIRTVASDGHRLALFDESFVPMVIPPARIIIPRKGALELYKLLPDDDSVLRIQIGRSSIQVSTDGLVFSSKLIEGRYPDYKRVLPSSAVHQITANKVALREALSRVAILSGEKFRGCCLEVKPNELTLKAQTADREEAEEQVTVEYNEDAFTTGFNVEYLTAAVDNIDSENVTLSFATASGACLVEDTEDKRFRSVVMPMRV